jgi:hypothetical protein
MIRTDLNEEQLVAYHRRHRWGRCGGDRAASALVRLVPSSWPNCGTLAAVDSLPELFTHGGRGWAQPSSTATPNRGAVLAAFLSPRRSAAGGGCWWWRSSGHNAVAADSAPQEGAQAVVPAATPVPPAGRCRS